MAFGDKDAAPAPKVEAIQIMLEARKNFVTGNTLYASSYTITCVSVSDGVPLPSERRGGDALAVFTAQEQAQLKGLLDKYLAVAITKVGA